MKVFNYTTNSYAAPFVSDTYKGTIEAEDPFEALKKVVEGYKHPAGLFAAIIEEPGGKLLARFLSSPAATSHNLTGELSWRQDDLYVNGEKVKQQPARYEIFLE